MASGGVAEARDASASGTGTGSVYAAQLATELVADQLGATAEQVCASLVRRGHQALGELQRDTKLDGRSLRDALLTLMQHNCVVSWREEPAESARPKAAAACPPPPLPARPPGRRARRRGRGARDTTVSGGLRRAARRRGGGAEHRRAAGRRGTPAVGKWALFSQDPQTVYEVQVDRILQRLRFPRFLETVEVEHGEAAESICEGLLEHGRLSVAQVVDRAADKRKVEADSIRGEVERTLVALIKDRYVERVPVASGTRPARPAPPRINTGRGRGRQSQAAQAAEAAEVAAQANRAREAQERFRIPQDLLQRANEASTGKRKRNDDDDEPAPAASADAGILWRVNYDEFNRRFRHASCVELVREKVGQDESIVLEAMLQMARNHETGVKEDRSPPLPEAEVATMLRQRPGDENISNSQVAQILESLAEDPSELVSMVGEGHGGKSYCVNMRRILDLIRNKEVEAVVRQRFGAPACRVFRLLTLKRCLEQKQIAEMAMLQIKDTRELLYRLFKAGYIQLQEVARTADHAPSRTFYLWRADHLRVVERVGCDVYRSMSKLRARLRFEQQKEQDLLRRLEKLANETQDGAAASGPSVTFTEAEHQRLQRFRKVADILETSLLRLDTLSLMFEL